MRRAAKKDTTHRPIARALADIGAEVFDVSGLPGALDMLVAWRGRLTWLEVKSPGCRGDLTPAEVATIARLRRVGAPVAVVETFAEACAAIGATTA